MLGGKRPHSYARRSSTASICSDLHPPGVAGEGWHDLKVTLKRARGDVTARPVYFVP